jgi:cell shape-determining protein MreC
MPKALTGDQVQSRKDKAVRFVGDALGDPGRAEVIEDQSPENYAERRKIELQNPFWRKQAMASKAELLERVKELEEENEQLQDQLDQVADIVAPYEDEDEGDEAEDEDKGEE